MGVGGMNKTVGHIRSLFHFQISEVTMAERVLNTHELLEG